jgi:hypothetical protein
MSCNAMVLPPEVKEMVTGCMLSTSFQTLLDALPSDAVRADLAQERC